MSNYVNNYCPKCNAKITVHSQFCYTCAFDLSETNSSPTAMPSAPVSQPAQPTFAESPNIIAETTNFNSVQTETTSSNMFSGQSSRVSVLTTETKIVVGGVIGVAILLIGGLMISSINSKKEKIDINVSTPGTSNSRYNTNTSYSSRTSTSNSASAYTSSSNSYSSSKTGRLITDLNIRDMPNKDAWSLGIHFMNAKVRVLEETSYETEGKVSTWYKVQITEYGCSKESNLGCGKNSPSDSDEGWINAKYVLLD